MAHFVDGFVIPVPKKNVKTYRAIAAKAGKVWLEHGALDYKECVGADLNIKGMLSFTKLAKAKPTETVIFSYIVYKSRGHRDRVNKKVMNDPRLAKMMADGKTMPFDLKRMAYGGFRTIVDLTA
jgi:uncharacterized protein YbaA (DUF1428 family)